MQESRNSLDLHLIDNATGKLPEVIGEIDDLVKIAANGDLPMQDRIEAYEDIIASEVGDTAMLRARNIERQFNFRQLFLKFEGSNPSGSHKDRIAFAQVNDALRRGYEKIVFATCGNYGVALAFAASLAGIACKIYIPTAYHPQRIPEMKTWDAEIVRAGNDYEEAVYLSSREAFDGDYYDANPGGQNTDLQLKAYGEIAYEIYDELRDAPAAVAVPVSNGTTLTGIYRGFVTLYRRGKTSRIPKIIAGSTSNKNPIIVSFKKNLDSCEDLNPAKIKESPINEPLINWHSIDGTMALTSIRNTGGWASDAPDKKMAEYAGYIKKHEGLSVIPASTAGLIALLEWNAKEALPGDRYVAVLTGRR